MLDQTAARHTRSPGEIVVSAVVGIATAAVAWYGGLLSMPILMAYLAAGIVYTLVAGFFVHDRRHGGVVRSWGWIWASTVWLAATVFAVLLRIYL